MSQSSTSQTSSGNPAASFMPKESRQPPNSAHANSQHFGSPSSIHTMQLPIPTEYQLSLLSLDYLRDLRRAYAHPQDLLASEQIDPDWLTVAVYALEQALKQKFPKGTDAWKPSSSSLTTSSSNPHSLPSLKVMTQAVVYESNPHGSSHESVEPSSSKNLLDQEDASAWYEYDDHHPSNAERWYPLNGLGGFGRGPLWLGEMVTSALPQMEARTRQQSEQEIIDSPLFQQFLQAVQSKGFFKDEENEIPLKDPHQDQLRLQRKEALYQDRFQKVVAKFRTKLAWQANADGTDGDTTQLDRQYTRRLHHIHNLAKQRQEESVLKSFSYVTRLAPGSVAPKDAAEAERLKNVGNTHMQRKDYHAAVEAYSDALKLTSSGPQSHVYYSNRAAAYLSLKEFPKAIQDSQRALQLKPDYGKAHARLGLSHFLLGQYQLAVQAYQRALECEPGNTSSQSYLDKARKRLQQQMPTSSQEVSEQEAERLKVLGNQLMAQKKYSEALEAYNQALEYSSKGLQSHVYYSNRAAALCYLERYEEAAKDSQQSLALKPDYGKAHARLGLARFFMEDYLGAIYAYEQALKYDPDNAASKSYMAKARLKWEQMPTSPPKEESDELDADARRLLHDPDLRKMARKAMSTKSPKSGQQMLMEDPEMMELARKAVHDPTMMAAVKAVVDH